MKSTQNIKCAPNHDVKILLMQNFWDWFRKTLERAGMRETSDPPPERKPPSFFCFLNISPFHSHVFLLSLSHSLWSVISQNFSWTHNLLSKKRHGSVYCGRSSCRPHRGGEDSIALFNHLVFINSHTWKEIGRVGDFLWDHVVPPNWVINLFQHLNLPNIQFTSGSRLIFCGSTPPGQQYGGKLTS